MDVVLLGFLIWFGASVTWVMYLAIMALKRQRDRLTWVAKTFAYPVLYTGLITDAIYNVIIGTVIFIQWPKEWLFTDRLERNLASSRGWRWKWARWFCVNLLDPFDPAGRHCG